MLDGRSPCRSLDDGSDFSDIPELSDKQLRTMRRVGRPPVGGATKVAIAFRMHPALLAHIRQLARRREMPYQTLMHQLLEKAVGAASGKPATTVVARRIESARGGKSGRGRR